MNQCCLHIIFMWMLHPLGSLFTFYWLLYYCLCVCVCVCARARARTCVHVCVNACMRACMNACMHACMRASVCVHGCMCVCVCMCLYSSTVKASFVCKMLCCEYHSRCFWQVPSSPFLKISYFTSKDETPAHRQTGEKQNDIFGSRKRWYIDIG